MPHLHVGHGQVDFTVEVFVVWNDRVLLRRHDEFDFWLSVGGHVELQRPLARRMRAPMTGAVTQRRRYFADALGKSMCSAPLGLVPFRNAFAPAKKRSGCSSHG